MSAMAEAANEIATEAMVTVCANVRPSFHPRKPARIAPTSGENAAMQESVNRSIFILLVTPAQAGAQSSFQASQIIHVDRPQIPEERHQDREADRRLGGGHRQDEEHE